MVWTWPTMPNRGAAEIAMRRSRSSFRPVISACTGAWKPTAAALAGMSWTRPSVIRKAPATRSTGTSASVEDNALNSLVPSVSPSACPASTTRTSSPLIFFRLSTSASCAFAVSWLRVPKFWLGLLSITTAATEDSGSRSSRVKEGLASASRISASAATRTAAPRARESSSRTAITTIAASAIHSTIAGTRGVNAMPYCILLSQPLDQGRRVDLVGLVVASQRVHHDVDAGAEGEFALPRFARRQRQHRLAVGADRPGAGEIVRGDDDRRDAVAAARRLGCGFIVVLARQGFDPGLAGIEAAGEIAQQIECLGQHMLARHRLEFGHVERGKNLAQRLHGRRLRRAIVSRRRLDRDAGVEHDGAALLHVGVDTVDGVLRRFRCAGHHRPVDQGEERKFVMGGINADGIAGLQRGALGQEQGQPGHPGLDD